MLLMIVINEPQYRDGCFFFFSTNSSTSHESRRHRLVMQAHKRIANFISRANGRTTAHTHSLCLHYDLVIDGVSLLLHDAREKGIRVNLFKQSRREFPGKIFEFCVLTQITSIDSHSSYHHIAPTGYSLSGHKINKSSNLRYWSDSRA